MGKIRPLGNVYEPEFVPVSMKMGDIIDIREDFCFRAFPRHGRAEKFF
jgi:hypothetical protein